MSHLFQYSHSVDNKNYMLEVDLPNLHCCINAYSVIRTLPLVSFQYVGWESVMSNSEMERNPSFYAVLWVSLRSTHPTAILILEKTRL